VHRRLSEVIRINREIREFAGELMAEVEGAEVGVDRGLPLSFTF
jgi:hypothetical protein